MAWEKHVFNLPAQVAGADLSAKQFYCVKQVAGTDNSVVVGSVLGERILGVLQNKPTSNKAAEICVLGVTKLLAGETMTAGMLWGSDASGKAQEIQDSNTGADVGKYANGVVLEGGAAGELITVTIQTLNPVRVSNTA